MTKLHSRCSWINPKYVYYNIYISPIAFGFPTCLDRIERHKKAERQVTPW